MALGIILMIAWMVLQVVVVLAAIGWGYQTGQWKDIEEPKHRMLLDLPMEPWPGSKRPQDQPGNKQPASSRDARR